MSFLSIVGAVFIAYYGIKLLLFFHGRIFSKEPNLLAKYSEPGRTPWAVVTGGSDGIGLGMCHDLAR